MIKSFYTLSYKNAYMQIKFPYRIHLHMLCIDTVSYLLIWLYARIKYQIAASIESKLNHKKIE